jgi:nucleoside 2-deoxyribosyltransferase
MQVFIAGIMQGSRLDRHIDDQDYRRVIAETILEHKPGAEILDPNELHPRGVDYGDQLAKQTLLEMAELAGRSDLVVAYVPTASMGTAIEMWQAFRAGVPVVTISPMAANWVVKHLSAVVLADLSAFRRWVAAGGLIRLMAGQWFDNPLNLD